MPNCSAGGATVPPPDDWWSPNDRLRFADLAPADRFCDLVLTGSVTSAVAYPGLVAVLASAYRFHAIGGSSSGAGIAAMAAAAEMRRRQGSSEGFRAMLDHVGKLSETSGGRTGLRRLFQPERKHRLLFGLLIRLFTGGGKGSSGLSDLLISWASLTLLLAEAVLVVFHALSDGNAQCLGFRVSCLTLGAVVSWTVIGSVAIVLATLIVSVCRLLKSDYGVCTGLAPAGSDGADGPALTEWLHQVIQEAAGRAKDDASLTFEDLAQAPGSPRAALGAGGASATKGIALEMYSANVSHGRPYRLPLDKSERLYFRPAELRRVVPGSVIDDLLRPYKADRSERWAEDKDEPDEQARWPLPHEKLPVILAVRMSVAFPLLFTAVRLWAPHGPSGREVLKPCIFVDGGLCSNFPIHLFDSAIPGWPTFGISLRDRKSKQVRNLGQRVFLPKEAADGRAEWWFPFDALTSLCGRLFGLASAMLSTIKDWNDATAARLPGVWDRVVRVELETDEGGLNIDMPKCTIERLAHYGVLAGRELLERYSRSDAPNGLATGWNEHRWVRLTRLRAALASYLDGIGWSMSPGRHAESMHQQIQRAIDTPPRNGEPALSPAQAAVMQRLLGVLAQAEQAFNAPGPVLPLPPEPRPELRQRAPL